jgi:hypothetical protein
MSFKIEAPIPLRSEHPWSSTGLSSRQDIQSNINRLALHRIGSLYQANVPMSTRTMAVTAMNCNPVHEPLRSKILAL